MDIEEINFKKVYNEIEKYSMEGSSLAQRVDKHIQKGRAVTIAAMLSLSHAKKSSDLFTRVLGIYLHGSGVQ